MKWTEIKNNMQFYKQVEQHLGKVEDVWVSYESEKKNSKTGKWVKTKSVVVVSPFGVNDYDRPKTITLGGPMGSERKALITHWKRVVRPRPPK